LDKPSFAQHHYSGSFDPHSRIYFPKPAKHQAARVPSAA
jgi:hypothetical protein